MPYEYLSRTLTAVLDLKIMCIQDTGNRKDKQKWYYVKYLCKR